MFALLRNVNCQHIFSICRYWCSTKVDNELEHIGGQGNWGFCRQSCPTITPVTSTPRSRTTTSPIIPRTQPTRPVPRTSDNENASEAFSKRLEEAYAESINGFTQNFMAVCWETEGDNFVFSPFSLHSVLSMLTSGSKRNSETEEEILDVFGSHRNIQSLELKYGQLIKSYKTAKVEKNLNFGNRIWTTNKYLPKIEETYQKKIENLYDAKFDLLNPTNSKKEVNDWVKNQTNGKIDKIIGMYT